MDKIVDATFDRVEKALATLVNSIANYTANPQAAVELAKADSELVDTLKLLHTHQENHKLILQKQHQSSLLDAKIKETLTLLATTRKELLDTPATQFVDQEKRWPVEYHELLAYARRISAFTIPPGGYKTVQHNAEVAVKASPEGSGDAGSAANTPAATPAPIIENNGITNTNGTANGNVPTTTTAIPQALQDFINPYTNSHWVPWPTDEQLRRGALAALQFMSDTGEKIEDQGEVEAEIERVRVEEEEEQERKRKEEMVRREVERARSTVVGADGEQLRQEQQQRREQERAKAQVFQGLGLLDDDDED